MCISLSLYIYIFICIIVYIYIYIYYHTYAIPLATPIPSPATWDSGWSIRCAPRAQNCEGRRPPAPWPWCTSLPPPCPTSPQVPTKGWPSHGETLKERMMKGRDMAEKHHQDGKICKMFGLIWRMCHWMDCFFVFAIKNVVAGLCVCVCVYETS